MSKILKKIARKILGVETESRLIAPLKEMSKNYILNHQNDIIIDEYSEAAWAEVDIECDIIFKDDLDPTKLVFRTVGNINRADMLANGEISSLRIGYHLENNQLNGEVKKDSKPKRKYNKKKK